MNTAELLINLKLADEATPGLKGVNNELQKFGKQAQETSTEAINSTKEISKQNETFIKGMKDSAKPINDVRWAVNRLRFFWMASFGTMALMVKSTSDEIKKLDDLAIRLGTTTEALSKKMYGFNIATPEARAGAGAAQITMSTLGSWTKWFGAKVTELYGLLTGIGATFVEQQSLTQKFRETTGREPNAYEQAAIANRSLSRATETGGASLQAKNMQEAVALEADTVEKIKQLTLSETEFKRQQFEQQIELLRKKGVTEQTIAQYTAAFNKKLMLEQTSMYVSMASTVWSMLSQTVEMAVGEDKRYAGLIKATRMGEAIINTATGVTRAFKDFPWPFSTVVAGIISALGAAQVGIIAAQPMAKGGEGIVTSPTLFLAGEAGAERFNFTPLNSTSSRSSSGVTVYMENAYFSNADEAEETLSRLSRLLEEKKRSRIR